MITSSEWSQLAEAAPNKILSRIMINLYPLLNKNGSLFLIYIGSDENKDIFKKYLKENSFNLGDFLKKHFSIISIKLISSITEEEINWIINYSNEFEAKEIVWIL